MLGRKMIVICGVLLCVLCLGTVSVQAVTPGGGGVILITETEYDFTVPGQIVEIPYVVWMADAGWWTGIAITNDSDRALESVKIKFITDKGKKSGFIIPKQTKYYQRTLEDIPAWAMKVDTLLGLYKGSDILKRKSLPSDTGSLKIFHAGDQPFSVTVYIGNGTGFSYQVFRSHSTQ